MSAPMDEKPETLRHTALLRRLAELDRLEPAAELDRAVLEAARRAIESAPASSARPSLGQRRGPILHWARLTLRGPTLRRPGPVLRWALPAGLTLALAAIATSAFRPGSPAAVRRVAAMPSQAPRPPASDLWRAEWHAPLLLEAPRTAPHVPPLLSVSPALDLAPTLDLTRAPYAAGRPQIALGNERVPPPRRRTPPSFVETDAHALELIVGSRQVNPDVELIVGTRQINPDVWLTRIRQLRAEGRSAEADREWRAFRKIYPAYSASSPGALDPLVATRPRK